MYRRPLSPHLQIYKLQITSVLSITHRLTGIFLTLGLAVLSLWLTAAVMGDEYYHPFQGFFGSFLGKVFLVGWTWALFYHLCNGIRHLFWDAGKGFELKTVTWSGWLVVASSVILTALSWSCCGMKGCCI